MTEKFSQFSVADLEFGARQRQRLAERRHQAQMQGRGRGEQSKMRTCIGCSFLALMCTWAYVIASFVFRGGDDDLHPLSIPGLGSQKRTVEMTGWNLLEKLHSIGINNPGELARILEEEDPFKVAVESPDRFQCPVNEADRFSVPDLRDHDKEEAFKAGQGFIYYQHLRKAGGTGFCEMAGRNMPTVEVPTYHCMPDNRGAMATPPWSKREFLMDKMQQNGYRITANEWDAFPLEHLDLPGAVFGTTFRHPVDRWYSQYRFEHVEHRDGSKPGSKSMPFDQWYKRMRPYVMGDNYYVKTFCGQANPPDETLMKDLNKQGKPKHTSDLSWSYHKFNPWKDKVSWEDLRSAIEVLQKFHLILVLDYVEDEMWALEEALGWKQARKQVLPHERQAVRENKKSIPAKEALSNEVWTEILHANVFDLLLFQWAKRIYLERSACRTFNEALISNLPPKDSGAPAHDDGREPDE